jgi:outer membrane protein TolC
MKNIPFPIKKSLQPGLLPSFTTIALVVLLAVTGCAAGPDFKRPDAPTANGYAPQPMPSATVSSTVMVGESQHFDVNKDIPFDWWKLFQSTKVDTLVERAFKANPTIQSAQAALKQAQEYANAQQGFFYPTVGTSYTASRTKLAGNMSRAYRVTGN